jgi:PAT family beta-lactamase induction signal transducer AmpG
MNTVAVEKEIPEQEKPVKNKPWSWVPSLYFIQGIPYGVVMFVAVVMYKNMGLGNAEVAFYTSWLYLPWVIKPLWAPIVDLLKSKKWWTVGMEFIVGVTLAGIAFTLPFSFWVQGSLALFWLLAFSSATHDIAADGFYMLGLRDDQQAFFVGIRSLAYRISMLFTQGAVVWLGGYFEQSLGVVSTAWSYILYGLAALMAVLALYHYFILPKVEEDRAFKGYGAIIREFGVTIKTFFQKDQAGIAIAFILLYRLGEAQLVKMTAPFFLDEAAAGGLGLTTQQVGIAYGTVGPVGLILGGILGGIAISRKGLKYWMWYMAAALNLPQIAYVLLAYFQISDLWLVSTAVFIETFGYGFGFTAFMVFMMYFSEGNYKTAHYALCSGFMALGMMLPGLFSGLVQEAVGYELFFIWVLISGIPGFYIISRLRINPEYGRSR